MLGRSGSLCVGAAIVVWLTTGGGHQVEAQGPPDANGRLASLHLVYEGAFRLPDGSSEAATFDYGGNAMGFDPVRRSLWIVGHDHHQLVAEVSVPDIRQSPSVDTLDTARLLRPFRDILRGRIGEVGHPEAKIGGLLPVGDDLVVTAWIYYDAEERQSLSHFRVAADGSVSGPVQLGTQPRQAGFVAGYMAPIPPDWWAELGGEALTGLCCVSIVTRTSSGPALSVFDPADVAGTSPVPAARVLGYPIDHPTIGTYEDGDLYNGATRMGGAVFPDELESVLFFGRVGLTDMCYGVGTPDQSLHRDPIPGLPNNFYCYDPIDQENGSHGYPYAPFVWAYRVRDLVAVRRGERQPWDVEPYAAGTIDLPYFDGAALIGAVAYDSATRRIFLTAPYQDGTRPVVHVLRLDSAPAPPPPDVPPPNAGGSEDDDEDDDDDDRDEGVAPAPGGERYRPWSGPPVGRAVPRP